MKETLTIITAALTLLTAYLAYKREKSNSAHATKDAVNSIKNRETPLSSEEALNLNVSSKLQGEESTIDNYHSNQNSKADKINLSDLKSAIKLISEYRDMLKPKDLSIVLSQLNVPPLEFDENKVLIFKIIDENGKSNLKRYGSTVLIFTVIALWITIPLLWTNTYWPLFILVPFYAYFIVYRVVIRGPVIKLYFQKKKTILSMNGAIDAFQSLPRTEITCAQLKDQYWVSRLKIGGYLVASDKSTVSREDSMARLLELQNSLNWLCGHSIEVARGVFIGPDEKSAN